MRSNLAIGLASIALLVALGGPAAATSAVQSATKAITGNQIKDGSIGLADISKKARKKLQQCLLLLEKDIPKEERYRAGRHVWYWYGFLDALRGEKP